MICNKCQKEINNNNKFCPNCGAPVYNQTMTYNQPIQQPMNTYPVNNQTYYYNQPNNQNKKNNKTAIIIVVAVVLIFVFLIAISFFFFIYYITSSVSGEVEKTRSNINEYESNITSNYNSNSNSNKDDDLSETLDSLSAWNNYSSVRNKHVPSYGKVLNGNWVSLSDNDVYWVFNNNTYYWYKSQSNLKDNYWYGTTKIYTGSEAFKQLGLSESKMNQTIIRSNGKLTSNDFKAIICTPTKLIVDGKDKTNTIKPGFTHKILWIIVDHGSEGIEGQYLNVSTGDTAYYFKVYK